MSLEVRTPSGVILELRNGRLFGQKDVSVIVNAVNRHTSNNEGINKAIHVVAGEEVMAELIEATQMGWATDGIIATGGYDTGFDMILHTHEPAWVDGNSGEYMALSMCYFGCLRSAARVGASSIGFCSIGTGVSKFPLPNATQTALDAICYWLDKMHNSHSIKRIVFAMHRKYEYEAYYQALRAFQDNWDL